MEDITFLQSLTLILLGLLFFKEQIIPWILAKLGMDPAKSNATKGQVDQLAEYVNHRQTEIMEQQTVILGEVKGTAETTLRKLDEWERHGVPIKKP
jgi:hypothetical protein